MKLHQKPQWLQPETPELTWSFKVDMNGGSSCTMEQGTRQRPPQGERISLGKILSFQKKISGGRLSGKTLAGNVARLSGKSLAGNVAGSRGNVSCSGMEFYVAYKLTTGI